MIIVTGHMHLDPSDLDDFTVDVQVLARSAKAREGCLSYAIVLDEALTGRMLVVERWRDQGALTTHLHAPETVAFVGKWGTRMKGDVLKYDAMNERSLMDS